MQLSPDQLDALQEIVNIGVGRAAALLNELVAAPITLQVPRVRVMTLTELRQELAEDLNGDQFFAVRLGFCGALQGSAELVFPTHSAAKLVSVLTGEELGSPDLDGVRSGTLTEVGNIVINGVLGSISNLLRQHLDYTLPVYQEDTITNLLSDANVHREAVFLLAQTHFSIKQMEIVGDIILVFEMTSFDALLSAIEQAMVIHT